MYRYRLKTTQMKHFLFTFSCDNEDECDLRENELLCKAYFEMKGFASGLALKQVYKN